MIGPLFAHPLAPPGKGVWVNGVLTSPAVPVATLSPSAPIQSGSEAGASGDSLPVLRSSRLSSGGDERGAGPFVSRLRFRCAACGAEPGAFCVRLPTDPPSVLAHRGRL